jgi:hypothetical protein
VYYNGYFMEAKTGTFLHLNVTAALLNRFITEFGKEPKETPTAY